MSALALFEFLLSVGETDDMSRYSSSGALIVESVTEGKRLFAALVAQCVALAFAVTAALFLLFAPTYSNSSEMTESSSSAGSTVTTVDTQTLTEVNGNWVMILLVVPIVLTLIPLLVRGSTRHVVGMVATTVLAASTILAITSIGLFFIPAVAAAVTAAILRATALPAVES